MTDTKDRLLSQRRVDDSLALRHERQIRHFDGEFEVPTLRFDRNNNSHKITNYGNAQGINNGDKTKTIAFRYEPRFAKIEQLFDIDRIHPGENFETHRHEQVKVIGELPPQARTSFNDMNLVVRLVANIKKCGFYKPTSVQSNCIPLALKQADIAACAKTGSGKTAAFLIPIIHYLMQNETKSGQLNSQTQPIALILCPARQIAIQIFNEARKLAAGTTLVEQIQIVYGGTGVQWNKSTMLNNTKMLIATPGRFMQFLEMGYLSLRCCKFVVLDEADRLLSFGFEHSIRLIFNNHQLASVCKRVTMMFSATFPSKIHSLAKQFLKPGYSFVTVGKIGASNPDIKQKIIEVRSSDKIEVLVQKCREIVGDCKMPTYGAPYRWTKKVLVFAERKRTTENLASYLCRCNLAATCINGDHEQNKREQTLQHLKEGKFVIVVATDVIARGIDIALVDCVINYDLPQNMNSYVHRIGRTGRVGNKATSLSFFDPQVDAHLVHKLVENLREAKQEVPEFLLAYGRENGASTNLREDVSKVGK